MEAGGNSGSASGTSCRVALCAAALAVVLACSAACRPAMGAAEDVEVPPVEFDRLRHGMRSAAATMPAGPRYETATPGPKVFAPTIGPGGDRLLRPYRGAAGPAAAYEVVASPSPMELLLLAAGVFALFVLLGIWRRRRADPFARPSPAARSGSPREIVALACDRCSRVVDVPRGRLAGGLYCPRCGSKMPHAR